MSVDTSENDLLGKTEEKLEQSVEQDQASLHPLHLLQQAIANMPALDPEKVQAVLKKINQASLEILGTEEERLNSAKRIAEKIIDESVNTDQEIPS